MQGKILEHEFRENGNQSDSQLNDIAVHLGIDSAIARTWFYDRRQKYKAEFGENIDDLLKCFAERFKEQCLRFQYSEADIACQVSIRYTFLLSEADKTLFESGSFYVYEMIKIKSYLEFWVMDIATTRGPWLTLHIDYAGPYQGHMFPVVIDSHTKWLEVFLVKAETSFDTIEKLRMLFSSFGLPHKIVSDNGSVFTSQEFQDFMKSNGIIYVIPYQPSSNGLAERAVQIFKRGLERQTEGSLGVNYLKCCSITE